MRIACFCEQMTGNILENVSCLMTKGNGGSGRFNRDQEWFSAEVGSSEGGCWLLKWAVMASSIH